MLNLVLFGPPGAGKGTQSAFLVERYHLVHLSTGDLFRYNIKNETELGVLAKVIHGLRANWYPTLSPSPCLKMP